MATPRKGSARWTETKIRDMAEAVEVGGMDPVQAKVAADLYRAAYHQRISRAEQKLTGRLVEDYIDDDEMDEIEGPGLKLIEGERVG
ncbi:MAG: hypothetical protein ACR2RF_20625 [Geminicoccaceae bacterium]